MTPEEAVAVTQLQAAMRGAMQRLQTLSVGALVRLGLPPTSRAVPDAKTLEWIVPRVPAPKE